MRRLQPSQLGIRSEVCFVHERDRRTGLLRIGVRSDEGRSLGGVGFDELLLRSLAHKVEPTQIAQTDAAAQGLIEVRAQEVGNGLPSPSRGWDAGALGGPAARGR